MNDNELQRATNTMVESTSYTIQDDADNERVPILNGAYQRRQIKYHILDKLFIVTLMFILSVGVLIGVYLLLTEGHEWKVPGIFNVSFQQLVKSPTSTPVTPL